MKVLVTGATGFIGNYVVNQLLDKKNITVVCTSTNNEKAKTFSWYDKVKYIECDLNEKKDDFFKFFEQPDLMIHLAWQGLPNYKDTFHVDRNLPNDCYLIKNMVENGLKNICITGTCFEYGLLEGCLKEDMITEPVTFYGIAKDTLRKYVEQLAKKHDFNYKWIRLFYMHGQGQSNKSILELLKKSVENGDNVFNMSGGEQLRDYLPVTTVAQNIIDTALNDNFIGVVNSCSGKPISIRRFVEEYIKENGFSIELNLGYYPYPDYEPMAFWGDDSLLNKVKEK